MTDTVRRAVGNLAWILKKSLPFKNSQNWEIENVQAIRESRLWRIRARFYIANFLGKEFFNPHRRLHRLRIAGVMAILEQ